MMQVTVPQGVLREPIRRSNQSRRWKPNSAHIVCTHCLLAAGQMIQVQIPGGQLVQAQVPQDVHPGQSFQIQVPQATFRPVAAPPQQPDAAIVQQLVSMGFSENGSKRAALAVNNSSPDEAAEWVFAHMEDADFNDPLPPPGQQHGPIDDVPLDEDEQLAWALAASQEGQPKTAPRLAMAEAAEKEALLV